MAAASAASGSTTSFGSRGLLLVAAALLLLATASTASTGWVVSAAGSAFAQDARPLRVVALGGAVTETVYALGAESVLVGVDRSSVWPEEATGLPSVGYYRTLGIEGVLSLEPDLVLAAEGSGPEVVLRQLGTAGVRVVDVPEWDTVDGAVARVHRVAEALGMTERGNEVARRVEAEIADARELAASATSRPKVLFVWGRGGGALLSAGRGTGAVSMIEAAGGLNAVEGFEGYKPLGPEAAIAAAPDVILVPISTLEGMGGIEGLLEQPGLAATPAARDGRVVAVDLLSFLGFGPRVGSTLETIVRALHPEVGSSP